MESQPEEKDVGSLVREIEQEVEMVVVFAQDSPAVSIEEFKELI